MCCDKEEFTLFVMFFLHIRLLNVFQMGKGEGGVKQTLQSQLSPDGQ